MTPDQKKLIERLSSSGPNAWISTQRIRVDIEHKTTKPFYNISRKLRRLEARGLVRCEKKDRYRTKGLFWQLTRKGWWTVNKLKLKETSK